MERAIDRSPDCISESGVHSIVPCEPEHPIFLFMCEHCFERFALLSETVMKPMEEHHDFIGKEGPHGKRGRHGTL